MMRVAVSIKAGLMTPSTLLRRLGSKSRKNKLYFAFRELGRVVRTRFLLRYISDPKLRQTIHAATNKSEQFNDFAQWTFFGGNGTITENMRHEQRKVVKYNHLVANMLIVYTVHRLTGVLNALHVSGRFLITQRLARRPAPNRWFRQGVKPIALSLNASFIYIYIYIYIGFGMGAALGSVVLTVGSIEQIALVGAACELAALALLLTTDRRHGQALLSAYHQR